MSQQDADEKLHPKVEAFLDKACAGITSSRRAREVRFELLTHIEEIEDELSKSHLTSDQIADEILRRMGDATELEKQIAQANRSPARTFFYKTFRAVSIIAFSGFVISSIVLHSRAVNRFMKDRAYLRGTMELIRTSQGDSPLTDFLKPVASGRDAGVLLNKLLPTSSLDVEAGKFQIDPNLREALSTADFTKIIRDQQRFDVNNVDFSWMKSLKDYDYWDVFATNQKEHIALPDSSNSLPGAWVVIDIVRARLVQGIQKNDLKSAIEETYHLCRLAYSTNVIIHSTVGLSSLRTILRAYQQGRREGRVGVIDWIKWTDADVVRARNTMRAMSTILSSLSTDPEQLAEVADHPEWSVGLCTGLSENILTNAFTAPFFQAVWPMELDLGDRASAVRTLLARNRERCRLGPVEESKYLAAIVDTADYTFKDSVATARYIQYVPYIRRIYGLELARMITPVN